MVPLGYDSRGALRMVPLGYDSRGILIWFHLGMIQEVF